MLNPTNQKKKFARKVFEALPLCFQKYFAYNESEHGNCGLMLLCLIAMYDGMYLILTLPLTNFPNSCLGFDFSFGFGSFRFGLHYFSFRAIWSWSTMEHESTEIMVGPEVSTQRVCTNEKFHFSGYFLHSTYIQCLVPWHLWFKHRLQIKMSKYEKNTNRMVTLHEVFSVHCSVSLMIWKLNDDDDVRFDRVLLSFYLSFNHISHFSRWPSM